MAIDVLRPADPKRIDPDWFGACEGCGVWIRCKGTDGYNYIVTRHGNEYLYVRCPTCRKNPQGAS